MAPGPNDDGPGIIAHLTVEDGVATFVIEDDGVGLPAKDRDRLTEPYVTTREKGTGLGLAIVKRIAALHGGSVELRNRSGGGMEARVCLPIGLMLPRDAV